MTIEYENCPAPRERICLYCLQFRALRVCHMGFDRGVLLAGRGGGYSGGGGGSGTHRGSRPVRHLWPARKFPRERQVTPRHRPVEPAAPARTPCVAAHSLQLGRLFLGCTSLLRRALSRALFRTPPCRSHKNTLSVRGDRGLPYRWHCFRRVSAELIYEYGSHPP
jgi:hypothetical protein|eukprot:COSAG06_NODE_4411_length_4289_cov_22.661098_3_plen_165_part_00